MQSAGVQVRVPRKSSQPQRRRPLASGLAESIRPESRARGTPGIQGLIGLGILLVAALLIVVGAAGA
jgi:hypothetical protein